MVEEQLVRRGISDRRALEAFRIVEREKFIPEILKAQSYCDSPLSIGEGQTISQPYIAAYMIEVLALKDTDKVLEIGTGSGYQTAILSLLAKEVYSLERSRVLAQRAQGFIDEAGYKNITIIIADGTKGLNQFAPYDAIIVSAAAPQAPAPLLEQIAQNGRMIIPIGERFSQVLVLFTKNKGQIEKEVLESCVFVPLIGEYGWREKDLIDK